MSLFQRTIWFISPAESGRPGNVEHRYRQNALIKNIFLFLSNFKVKLPITKII